MKKQFIIQANVREDLKEQFEDLYSESGANSKGEFISMLVESFVNPETIVKKVEVVKEVPVEKEVEVIREIIKEVPVELNENQILVDLKPDQLALLKEICNNPRTQKRQNSYIKDKGFIKKFGEILIPFELDNESHNIKAALVNIILLNAYQGWGDWTETYSKKEFQKIINEANGVQPEEKKGFWD